MMRDRVSTFLFLGIAVFTVLGELTEIGWFRDTAVVSVLLLLVLEFTRIPDTKKRGDRPDPGRSDHRRLYR